MINQPEVVSGTSRITQSLLSTLLVVALTACSQLSSATSQEQGDVEFVNQFIVKYEVTAPELTSAGQPWGAQCVEGEFRDRLSAGLWIGAGMRVLDIEPAVAESLALSIAEQLGNCPHIEWAEADTVRYSTS